MPDDVETAVPLAPLRLLVLSWRDERHPEAGGAEVFLHRVTTGLAARGHHVTVMSAGYPGSLTRETLADGRRMVRRGGRFSVYGWGMWESALAGRWYDAVIDIQNGVPFWSPLVTRVPVVNVVHHVHREQWGEVFGPARARLGWWLEGRVAPTVYQRSHYVAVSRATQEELVSLGVTPDRITIVTSGLDVRAPDVVPLRSVEPSLVVLGRLVPHKRVEIALRTVARLRDSHPGLRLTVLGQGYWSDELHRVADELGISDRVRFAGFVSHEEKELILGSSWLHLLPSLKEGWGLAVVEAGMLGTPTIAFRDAGGVTESVVDGVTGVLVQDESGFVDAVAALLLDPDARSQMGLKAHEHARQFDWDRTTAEMERIIRAQVRS